MTSPYIIGPLESDRAALAYPLVRDIIGGASLDEWLRYVEALTAPSASQARESGIIIAERHGYIRGLFSHSVKRSLLCGRVFVLDEFAVLEMAGREGVIAALMKTAREMARRRGCQALYANIPPDAEWASELFLKAGHSLERMCYCLQLPPND